MINRLDAITLLPPVNSNQSGASAQDDGTPHKHEDPESHNEVQDNNGPPPKRRKLADSATRQSSTQVRLSEPHYIFTAQHLARADTLTLELSIGTRSSLLSDPLFDVVSKPKTCLIAQRLPE